MSAVPLAPRFAPALKASGTNDRRADADEREPGDRAGQRGHGDREHQAEGRDHSSESRHRPPGWCAP